MGFLQRIKLENSININLSNTRRLLSTDSNQRKLIWSSPKDFLKEVLFIVWNQN